jgi:mediator of RNA polymerase II transcription subunit 13
MFLQWLNHVRIFLGVCFIPFIVNPCADGDSSASSRDPLLSGGQLSSAADSNHDDDDVEPPAVVVYLVDPFTIGSDSTDLQRLSCLSLLRCFTSVLTAVPESVRNNISVQVCCMLCFVELHCNSEKASSMKELLPLKTE